jgi:2-methylcitrate dehydratase PrpD
MENLTMATHLAEQQPLTQTPATPSRDMAHWVAKLNPADIPERAFTWAKHALLDWFGVTIAGAQEPLTEILVADALAEGGSGSARLIGRPERVIASQAALINGSASHALDYDDVHFGLGGHPSAPVLPALLALAEQHNASGRELLTAFIAGYEVECLIGTMIGSSHYEDGWHNTATIGTFGAAAAGAKLLGLSAAQTAMALGIAATQAAGLKSMFGTMCKPLHAGKAALNGLLAARLASRGFTSRGDALECEQGFAATQSRTFTPLPIRPDPDAPYAVEANLFKYHAACYLTHSPIEAVSILRRTNQLTPDDVDRITLWVSPGHLKVCNILAPATGLEIKFSLRHTAALALSGDDTAALATYSDANAERPDLVALREKVEVETKSFPRHSPAEVVIELSNGERLQQAVDVGEPAQDVDRQWMRLTDKFHSLADPICGVDNATSCINLCATLETSTDLQKLLSLVSG